MGSVQEQKSKSRSGNNRRVGWRAMWRDHDGVQRSKAFARKIDAERHLALVEGDLARGEYIDDRLGAIPLEHFINQHYLPTQPWRPSTKALADSHIRNHINPALGRKPLNAIRHSDVQGLVTSLSRKGLSPRTVEAIYRRLVAILRTAQKDRRIARNPATDIRLPSVERSTRGDVLILTTEDVRNIADTVPPWLAAYAWTIALAGLRPAEAAGLTLERLDLDELTIEVDRQLVTNTTPDSLNSDGERRRGGIRTSVALTRPKTEASVRIVPISRTLADELLGHLDQWPAVDFGQDAALVFTNRDGRPLRRNVLGDAWVKARLALELPTAARGWHTLRHFYASMLIDAGLSVKTVQARLGHATATETLNTYAHLWPSSDDDTRNAIEHRLGNPAR